jgi:segregation and condensation protein B
MWGGGEHPWGWQPGSLATHASPAAILWSWRLGPAETIERESGTSSSGRSPALARLEAALFVAEGALTAKKLAQFAALPDSTAIPGMVEELNAGYEVDQSAWRVERLATGYQLMTRPVFARWLDKVHERQARLKLSPPAMETLTIIAYRQPLTRADLEEVRGVQSTELLKQLMERGLVKVVGEHDSLGRPYLYGTTRLFLESFGIRSLEDMPMADELRKPANAPVVEVNADPEVAA